MVKLCIGTYIKALLLCKAEKVTQKNLVTKVFKFFSDEFPDDDSVISNIARGIKNPPQYVAEGAISIKNNQYERIIAFFEEEIIPMINANKLHILVRVLKKIVEDDSSIRKETIVNPITKTTKENIVFDDIETAVFISGLIIYILQSTNNTDSKKYVDAIDEKYVSEAEKLIVTKEAVKKKKSAPVIIDKGEKKTAKVSSAAKNFCIKFEKELVLLPLCELAYNLNPLHKHHRKLYTEFNKLSEENRKTVLSMKEIPVYSFPEGNWIYEATDLFESINLEKGLSKFRFLYDGAKYLHRAMERYSDEEVESIDPWVFDSGYKQSIDFPGYEYKIGMTSYINEFLYSPAPDAEYEAPLNYMWEMFDLRNAQEKVVTYCICSYIISCCKMIIPEDSEFYANVFFLSDYDYLIKRQEDLYYYAIFMLYNLYMSMC